MFDAYDMVKTTLSALIRDVYPCGAPITDSDLCEVSAPLPVRLGLPGEECREALQSRQPALCLDVPLLSDISVSGGYLCFHLSCVFYRAAAERVNASVSMPELPDQLHTRLALAFARARMYAARPGTMPDDPRIQHALWLCFALSDFRPGRIKRAVDAVLSLWEIPIAEREVLMNESGAAMAAMARLLFYFGIERQAAE